MLTSKTISKEHSNNFNLIRLMAAFQVLIVHAVDHFDTKIAFSEIFKATPGVPIFFFISGYLIYGAYVRVFDQGLRIFFLNRLLRIYPALFVCIFLSTITVLLTGYFHGKDIETIHFLLWILGQGTIFQFYNPEFMRAFGVGVLNGALWTIAVELQFYILTPLMFYIIKRKPVLLSIIFIVSLLSNLYIRYVGDERTIIIKIFTVSFAPWIYMFLFGCLVASSPKLKTWVLKLPFLLIFGCYLISMFVIGGYVSNAQNSINPISYFFLACMILKVATVKVPILISLQQFFRKSDFSYGLYIYHMPIINTLIYLQLFDRRYNLLAVIIISLVAATLSWYLIERPALRHKI
jgi:peptidoglycan/LPS O-acetylase OafA/YrhL